MDEVEAGLAQCDTISTRHRCPMQLPQAALDSLPHPAAVGLPEAASINTISCRHRKLTIPRLQQPPLACVCCTRWYLLLKIITLVGHGRLVYRSFTASDLPLHLQH